MSQGPHHAAQASLDKGGEDLFQKEQVQRPPEATRWHF